MGERRVSEAPPLPVRPRERAGETAGAAGPHRGLRSRTAAAGAPVSHGAATRMLPGLPGAAAPPPGLAEQAVDLLTTFHSIRGVRSRYPQQTHLALHGGLDRAHFNLSRYVKSRYEKFGGEFGSLVYSPTLGTKAEQAYRNLRKNAGQAENAGDSSRASAIRKALNEIDRHAVKVVQQISGEPGPDWSSSIGRPPATAAAAVPQWDWCTAYRNLSGIKNYFVRAGRPNDARRFQKCTARLADYVYQRFVSYSGTKKSLLPRGVPLDPGQPSRPEQMYRYLEVMADRAEAASGAGETPEICASIQTVNEKARNEMHKLTADYGSLAVLAAKAGMTEWQAPASGGPIATHTTPAGHRRAAAEAHGSGGGFRVRRHPPAHGRRSPTALPGTASPGAARPRSPARETPGHRRALQFRRGGARCRGRPRYRRCQCPRLERCAGKTGARRPRPAQHRRGGRPRGRRVPAPHRLGRHRGTDGHAGCPACVSVTLTITVTVTVTGYLTDRDEARVFARPVVTGARTPVALPGPFDPVAVRPEAGELSPASGAEA